MHFSYKGAFNHSIRKISFAISIYETNQRRINDSKKKQKQLKMYL